MKRITLLVLVLAFPVFLKAQQEDAIPSSRPKVGVVLSGGGAKGAVHIGALQYFEEMGIPVDYVAGTSMGSIVGGLYALGYSPEEMKRLISDMDWSEYIGNKIDRTYLSKEMRDRRSTNLITIPFGDISFLKQSTGGSLLSQLPSAYVNNSSLINLFNDLCIGYQKDMDFNDLPIPFACIATDLITGKEVVLREGNLPTAMRASMAIPGVFAPVHWEDYILIDGGLVNNFPADVLREMGADIIIGVEVINQRNVSPDNLKSLPQLMARLIINSTSPKRKENRKLCDIHIVPDISGFTMLSFTSEAIETLVDRGYQRAQEYHDQLLAVKQYVEREANHPVNKELHAPKALNFANESVYINAIDIQGVSTRESRWLMRKGRLKKGQYYSKDDIERAMSIYRGTGCFDEISYTIKETDSTSSDKGFAKAYALAVDAKPASPHVIGLGVRYDTEEGAALLLNLNLNEKRFGKSKFGVSTKLSYSPRIKLKYTYSRSSLANFNLAYEFTNEHFKAISFSNSKRVNLRYKKHDISGSISQFHLLNFSTTGGVSFSSVSFDPSSLEGSHDDSIIFVNNRLFTPFVHFAYDNLDDAYFAHRGIYARLNSHCYIDMLKGNEQPSFDVCYSLQGYITPGNGRFTIIPQLYGRYIYNVYDYFNCWNIMGGEVAGRHFDEQLPFIGIASVQSVVNNAAVLRCDLRYNFYGKHYLTAMYNYMLDPSSIVFGGNRDWTNGYGYHGAGLKYSYDSPLGPVSLTGQWSDITKQFGAYFSFGYTF